jgi:hypothetical protein
MVRRQKSLKKQRAVTGMLVAFGKGPFFPPDANLHLKIC